jgi:hypothetical protein
VALCARANIGASRDAKTIWKGAAGRRDNVSELWAWLGKRDIARLEAAEPFEDVDLAKVPIEHEDTPERAPAQQGMFRLDRPRRERACAQERVARVQFAVLLPQDPAG